MNYTDIQNILDRHGIQNDPAFDDVSVAVNRIPANRHTGKIPLGLYFPDDALIVVPPFLDPAPGSLGESVVLHEFGHRDGHYNHSDISELYAEIYRQQLQSNPVGYEEINFYTCLASGMNGPAPFSGMPLRRIQYL